MYYGRVDYSEERERVVIAIDVHLLHVFNRDARVTITRSTKWRAYRRVIWTIPMYLVRISRNRRRVIVWKQKSSRSRNPCRRSRPGNRCSKRDRILRCRCVVHRAKASRFSRIDNNNVYEIRKSVLHESCFCNWCCNVRCIITLLIRFRITSRLSVLVFNYRRL